MKTSTLSLRNSIQCLFTLIPLLLASFWFSARVQAVSPAPDGGYAGGNTAEGTNALFSLTSGVWNTAIGQQSLYHVTIGRQNTATGYQTLFSNTTGSLSTAYGSQSLYNNTTGSFNTATGFRTLYANTEGSQNTAIGYEALALNTTGHDNTATGFEALYHNTPGPTPFPPGSYNTAVGSQALFSNTSGENNTANGYRALYGNTVGFDNTAVGYGALSDNPTGDENTAIGRQALGGAIGSNNTAIGSIALAALIGEHNTATGASALSQISGSNNTADGFNALGPQPGVGDDNTAIGSDTLSQLVFGGNGNTALGSGAGSNLTEGDNNIYVGNPGVDEDSGTIRIGSAGTQTQTFIAGIFNVNEGGTILPVYINSDGQLGTQPPPSSQRFKKAIKRMDNVSEAILALKPVTFCYKNDTKGTPQFGLVAEDVAKVNPDLVLRDNNGAIYTVRYEAVDAMLLNEFLKEHRKVEELEANVAKLISRLEEEDSKIERISNQLEINRPARDVVANH